jgi:hypothetical protein
MKVDFSIHDTLNPDFWDGFDLKPEVRKKLLQTALEFHKYLKIKAKIKDIVLTGSSSNFNYSKDHSDLDLHLVYDFDDVLSEADEDDEIIDTEKELVKEYLAAKKTLWNESYEITIHGTNVELYAEDVDDTRVSSGTFSVVRNVWVSKPEKIDVKLDLKTAKAKSEALMRQIDSVIEKNQDTEKIWDKIKRFRQMGLQSKDGEFSPENIAFKILRRVGYLEKLSNHGDQKVSDDLSIK